MPLKLGVFLDVATVDNGDLRLDALDRQLPEWRFHPQTQASDTARRIREADVVITNKVRLGAAELGAAGNLKLVLIAATGTDVVDLQAAKERGVLVCNVRDYCSDSVAQHVLAMMLNLVSHQAAYSARARSGEWRDRGLFSLHDEPIRELHRLTLGIIGYGTLGKSVANLARAVGMNVLVGERRGRDPRPARLEFRQLVKGADIISLHCPLTSDTRHMFDRDVFRAMKKDALLINTARGDIVNEQHLADALRAGEIGGAGIDVFSEEPPADGHPLLASDIPNLIITPHNAWASSLARQECIDQLTAALRAFERGTPLNRVA
jgi:glycerate dehydrogenase